MAISTNTTKCLSLPVTGAWKRLYGGDARANMIQRAFSSERLAAGLIYGVFGAKESGKTSAAFAVADRFGYGIITPSSVNEASDFQLLSKQSILLIDPIDAFSLEELQIFIENKPKNMPVILVSETEDYFDKLKVDIRFQMKYPSTKGILNYISKMLENYKNHTLTNEDLNDLAIAFTGLSFPQVNSIVVDAALTCLSEERDISKEAFIDAIRTFKMIKSRYHNQ